jgi:hypothetical protein
MKRILLSGLIFLLLSADGLAYAAAQGRGNWERLGRQQVDFRADHDRINVGRSEGRFRQLEIRVQGAPVEIRRMIVTFGNDEKFNPKIHRRFDESSRSHVIDLPGDRRIIKRIDFDYVSPNRRAGKATVEVYAR